MKRIFLGVFICIVFLAGCEKEEEISILGSWQNISQTSAMGITSDVSATCPNEFTFFPRTIEFRDYWDVMAPCERYDEWVESYTIEDNLLTVGSDRATIRTLTVNLLELDFDDGSYNTYERID